MVQDYLDTQNMTRKELAEKLGVSKGYISQILNGESDHRLSKIVSLSTALGKAPYIYLKELDTVIKNDQKGNNIYIDFEELELKAKRCELLDNLGISNFNSYMKNFYNFNSLSFNIFNTLTSTIKLEEELKVNAILKPKESTHSVDPKDLHKSFADAA